MMSDLSDTEFVASGAQPLQQAPVEEPAEASGLPRLLTLVPDTAIQFVDAFVSDAATVVVRRRYFEEGQEGAADEPGALYVVTLDDGVFHHPITREITDASLTYTVEATAALAAFAGTWLPIPLLRVLAPDTGLGPVLDQGPTNWARVFIAPAEPERDDAAGWHIVLAIDTTIASGPAPKGRAGPSPTLADLAGGATFQFSADENDVGAFVTEAWVDDWVREAYEEHFRARQRPGDEEWLQERPLEHIAHYLTLLSVLAETGVVPDLDFLAPQAGRDVQQPVAVDLALDIGAARTLALLRETSVDGDPTVKPLRPLPLRDLSRPWITYGDILPSRIEFARASFGREALSRWSGRANAFYWPSLARVGFEAERLASAQPPSADLCGVASPIRYLWDTRRSDEVWRFSRGEMREAATTARGTIVAGPQLAQLTDSGELTSSGTHGSATTKPRFSRSSLTTFFAAEVILQALGAINAPATGGGSTVPRRLGRIVLSVPGNLSDEERRVLRLRVENAVDLVWSGLGSAATHARPRRPDVTFAADNATNAQTVYLYNEIVHKFHGKAREYFELLGKTRPGRRSGRSLRIASFDIGAATTAISVATYDLADNGQITREAELVDGLPAGGDDILKAVAERHLLPALTERLGDAGLTRPEMLLHRLFDAAQPRRDAASTRLATRIAAHLLRPAAIALLEEHAASRAHPDDVPVTRILSTLLANVDSDARSTADALDQLAADEGAEAFSPLSTPVTFLHRELARTIGGVLAPVLASAVRLVHAMDCDVVLLAGWPSRLPVVLDTLLQGLPTRPNRIIAMHDYRVAGWYPGRLGSEKIADAKSTAAAGALLEAVGVLRLSDRQSAPDAHRHYLGRLAADGTVSNDDLLFTLAPAGSREAPDGERTAVLASNLPAVIGTRRVALEAWPATPLYHLSLKESGRRDGPRQPIKVTFERVPGAQGSLDTLVIAKACDVGGTPIMPDELELRPQSIDGAGSWLDTGALHVAVSSDADEPGNERQSGGKVTSHRAMS